MNWKDLFRNKEKDRRQDAELRYQELKMGIIKAQSRSEYDRLAQEVMDFNASVRDRYRKATPSLTEFWFVFYLTHCVALSSLWTTAYSINFLHPGEEIRVVNPKNYL